MSGLNNAGGAYSQDEQNQLNKYQNRRNMMIDELFKDDKAPESSREMRLANELISAGEASIHTNVNNRIKHEAEANNSVMKVMVVEMIKATSMNTKKERPIDASPILDDSFIPEKIVPGHAEYNMEPLNPKEFDPNKEED